MIRYKIILEAFLNAAKIWKRNFIMPIFVETQKDMV